MNIRNTWLDDLLFGIVGYGGVALFFIIALLCTSPYQLEQALNKPFEPRYKVGKEAPLPTPTPRNTAPPVATAKGPPFALATTN